MKKLPKFMPLIAIEPSNEKPFEVKWQELAFWFFVPRLGQRATFGFYDQPDRRLSGAYVLRATRRAIVNGVEGVEIEAQSCDKQAGKPQKKELQTFVAQMTDTHSRWLLESHFEGDVRQISTFLDGDFLSNWGFGQDNCGMELNLSQRGTINRQGNRVTFEDKPYLMDVVGRSTVRIGKNCYDCVCVLDVSNHQKGMIVEHYVAKNGRSILGRRYNSDEWKIEQYKTRWSEKLPSSDRLIVNDKPFICWYECLPDYVLAGKRLD